MSALKRSWLVPHGEHLARRLRGLFLALGGALIVLLLGSSHWQATASLTALGDLRQQADRVERLDSLLIQLIDAENAVRGYVLSRNQDYLEPYTRSQTTVNHTLEEIRWDLGPSAENDDALTDLSGLVSAKLHDLDRMVERGSASEETPDQDKRYTDRIRDRILGLKTRLAIDSEVSFERSTRHVERTWWVVATMAVGVLVLIALLLVVVGRQLKLRERLAGLLQSENQRLDMLVQERTAELSDLASYLTNAREVEKARLARELHDELGALLTAAKMELDWIAHQADDVVLAPCRERLARLKGHLDSGIALKRRIIEDLHPSLLEMLGLVSALRALGEEFSRDAEMTLNLVLPQGDVAVAPEPALALFRIAQESLTNIRKHAHARQVKLALSVKAEELDLEIEDDGQGFNTGPARRRHHGLMGMKHRVQMCAGEFLLTSRPGAGTRIVARIPLTAVSPTSGSEDQDGIA